MGVFDDHVAIMGDWMPPSPSPRSFFSSMNSDDPVAQTIAEPGNEINSGALFTGGSEKWSMSGNADQNCPTQDSIGGEDVNNSSAFAEPKLSFRGGLRERMAARAGFNAPRLNTESIRQADLSKNPEARSPCLTIPPGLSPTTLLDSPVFLSNSLAVPSPTTGKFSFPPSGNNRGSTLMSDDPNKARNTSEDTSSFAFKPIAESGSFAYFNAANKVHASGFAPVSFPSTGAPIHSDTLLMHQNAEPARIQTFSNSHEKNRGSNQTYPSVGVADNSPPLDEPHDDDGDRRSGGDPMAGSSQADDGYNWRKYGQKQVKGSEYPRSYYKCTHPNCPVKKKVERSHEGHITEIIYKGAHNHPKPPPSRRSSSNAISDMQQQLESEQPGTGANGDPIWSNMQKSNTSDRRQDNLEATNSTQEYSNGSTLKAQNGGAQYEVGDGVSTTFSNDEEDDDRVTHGSVSLGYDGGEGDESESKRRRIETYASDMSGASRAIREPRVVVQTTSEVDILDDGYRWRKYGQKVVKGNPNPRSYYKCTSTGCNVRKHVERASHDLKSVITTYEGKHNHDVPAARNSSHANSNMLPNQQGPTSTQVQRPEPSQLQRPSSLGSFGFPGRPNLGPGPGFGFGMNQRGLGLAGFGYNLGQQYLGHQPRAIMNEMGFVLPKAEPKVEPLTDSVGLNSSDGSSVYQQLMSRSLGPHM